MATEAQTLANRLNSQKSTGPKTKEGKDASRRNALKHGLTAEALAGDEDGDLIAERTEAYGRRFRPASAEEDELVGRLAVDEIRSDRCRALFVALVHRHALQAQNCWDLDRRAEAEALASRLPKDPGRVAAELKATRYGCELMIERWEALGRIAAECGGWDEAQRSMALDLLGVHRDLRNGPTPADPTEDDNPEGSLQTLADSEAARLRTLKAGRLDDRDAWDRDTAERGIGAEMSRPLVLLHRYETAINRRWDAALRHFLKRDRRGASSVSVTTPHPNPPPQGGRGPDGPSGFGTTPSPLAGEGWGGGGPGGAPAGPTPPPA